MSEQTEWGQALVDNLNRNVRREQEEQRQSKNPHQPQTKQELLALADKLGTQMVNSLNRVMPRKYPQLEKELSADQAAILGKYQNKQPLRIKIAWWIDDHDMAVGIIATIAGLLFFIVIFPFLAQHFPETFTKLAFWPLWWLYCYIVLIVIAIFLTLTYLGFLFWKHIMKIK